MSGIFSLGEQLPVRNVQGVLVGVLDENHFIECIEHSFVKNNVSTVHQSQDREE